MSATPSHDPDPERDAWLREALRHAPDAQTEPPRALSDAIRREAHAAAARGVGHNGGRSAGGLFASIWAWLARPQAAAGFASVMVATLVGVLWWDRPMPAPSEPPAAAVGRADEPRPRASEPAAAVPRADNNMADAATSLSAPSIPSTASPPLRTAQAELERNTAAMARRAPASRPPMQPQMQPPSQPHNDAAAERSEPEQRSTAKTAQPPLAEAARAAAPDAAATAPAQESVRERAKAADRRRESAADSAPAAATAPTPRDSHLAAWRASIAMEPQRWRWQLGARNAQPADAALSAWLARLDAATAGRWRAVPQGAAQAFAPATAPGAPADLTLLRDGVPVARWALRSDRTRVTQTSTAGVGSLPSVLSADLDGAEAAALAELLAPPPR